MHTARRFLVTVLVPALIVSIFAVGAAAAHGSDGKVTLCHFANHKFVKITVSTNAKPAHMQQGDVDPDEYGECNGGHDGDNDNDNDNDNDGNNNDGNQEGNHDGQNGDGHEGHGSRDKSSHVRQDGGSSASGGGDRSSKSNDKA